MKIFRRYKLVAPAALMLAAIFFTPSAWCGDSASLASIGRSVGASRSAGGEFDKLMELPDSIQYYLPKVGGVTLYKECVATTNYLKKEGIGSVVIYNGQPCVFYYSNYCCAFVNSNGVVVKTIGL